MNSRSKLNLTVVSQFEAVVSRTLQHSCPDSIRPKRPHHSILHTSLPFPLGYAMQFTQKTQLVHRLLPPKSAISSTSSPLKDTESTSWEASWSNHRRQQTTALCSCSHSSPAAEQASDQQQLLVHPGDAGLAWWLQNALATFTAE